MAIFGRRSRRAKERGWFHVAPEGLVVKEIMDGITKEEIEQRVGCPAQFAADRRPGSSRIEAEKLGRSSLIPMHPQDNASLYLKAHVTPCSGRVVANWEATPKSSSFRNGG